MSTYYPATQAEIDAALAAFYSGAPIPDGFAVNLTWPEKVRRVDPDAPAPAWPGWFSDFVPDPGEIVVGPAKKLALGSGQYPKGDGTNVVAGDFAADVAAAPAVTGAPLNALLEGLVGDDSTDNTAALATLLAKAKSQQRPLYFPRGTYRYSGDFLVNWHSADIRGDGPYATLLKQMDPSKDGLHFQPVSAAQVLYAPTVRDLQLVGPGSGSGVGINLADDLGSGAPKNGPLLMNVLVTGFGSHGIASNYTDYLTMIRVKTQANGGHGWYANTGTRASVVLGGGFHTGSTTVTPPTGMAGMYLLAADGLTVTGTEFGQCEYGVILPSGGSLVAKSVHFAGVRFEGNTVADLLAGTNGGTSPYPSRVTLANCSFLGNNVRTPLVKANGVEWLVLTECNATQVPSGGVFVEALTTSSFSKVAMVRCATGTTSSLFKESNGTLHAFNEQTIVYGGDASTKSVLPLPLTFRVPGATAATDSFTLGMSPLALTVTAVTVVADQAIGTSGTNFWAYAVNRYNNGTLQGVVASGDSTGGGLSVGRRSQTITLGGQLTLLANDVLTLDLTKTGTPANLVDFAVTVRYQPA